MKKFLSLLVTFVLVTTTMILPAGALEYGEEWKNYTETSKSIYSDVPSNHWAFDSIARTSKKNWFGGYPDGNFRPDASITRAEALKVFAVFLGLELTDVIESSYYDVSVNEWYSPYIEAGKALLPQRTNIQGKVAFQPDMPITREDTIYAIVIATGYETKVKYADQSVLNMFTDISSISSQVKPYVAVAVNEGLVSGYDDSTIGGQNPLTRAEFATLLYRASFFGPISSPGAKLSKVDITPSGRQTLKVGESFAINAQATYSDNTKKEYTSINPYTDDTSVVSINKNIVTALYPGTCAIWFNDENLLGKSIVVVVEKPDTVPIIKIDSYADETEDKSIIISGKVTDETDTEITFTCNGKEINLNKRGEFSEKFDLNIGKNKLCFVAENAFGNDSSKTITIERVVVEDDVKNDNKTITDTEKNDEESDEVSMDKNDEEKNEDESLVNTEDSIVGSHYLMEVCPPYETSSYYKQYLQNEGKSFSMGGNQYTNGFTFETAEEWALFNLNGEFYSIKFTIGHVDGSNMYDQTLTFLADGKIVKQLEVKADSLPQTITIYVDYSSQLKIMNGTKGIGWARVGFGDITFERAKRSSMAISPAPKSNIEWKMAEEE